PKLRVRRRDQPYLEGCCSRFRPGLRALPDHFLLCAGARQELSSAGQKSIACTQKCAEPITMPPWRVRDLRAQSIIGKEFPNATAGPRWICAGGKKRSRALLWLLLHLPAWVF